MSEANIKAVLTRLSIRTFPNTRQDQKITDEVRLKKALGIGAGKWVKHVFPEEAFKNIRECGGEARRRHYDLTLPWEDGYRLLPSAAHASYEDQFKSYGDKFWKAIGEFEASYDKWVKLAKEMHGKTYDPSLYPDWRNMRGNFGFGAEYTPVPKSSHFITGGIAADAVAEMKADLETHNEARVKAAVQDTYTRVMAPVQAIAEKLSNKETIFRDSLIENVKTIVGLVPSLNLTDDADLSRIAKEIGEKFANLDPEILRSDLSLRKETAKAAKELVAQFGKIGKRRFA
ncbi:MAG: uncharacterized protein JWR19_2176 [Pedosphaera sp.]|nr:uncharacterized protein [Pedosphaera sp.]